MGFLDKVSKGISDTVEGLTKAVNEAQSSISGTPSAPPSTPGAPVPIADEDFIDGTQPQTWLDPGQLTDAVCRGGVISATFEAAPQVFARDDAIVARFVSSDGTVTIDLASVTEAFLGQHDSWEATLAALKAGLVSCSDRPADGFDWAFGGSSGAGHARFVAGLADLIGRVDVYAPGGPDYVEVGRNVLFDACRLGDT